MLRFAKASNYVCCNRIDITLALIGLLNFQSVVFEQWESHGGMDNHVCIPNFQITTLASLPIMYCDWLNHSVMTNDMGRLLLSSAQQQNLTLLVTFIYQSSTEFPFSAGNCLKTNSISSLHQIVWTTGIIQWSHPKSKTETQLLNQNAPTGLFSCLAMKTCFTCSLYFVHLP